MPKFLLYTVVGSAIWNTVLVVIGHNLGNNWDTILGFFDNFQHFVIAACVIVFVAAMVWWFGFYRRKKSTVKKTQSNKKSTDKDEG